MELVDARIARIMLDERHDRQLVTICDRLDDQRRISLAIGQHEALAIERALKQDYFPRPLTHDLILGLLDINHASLEALRIVDLQQGTYFAELAIRRADGEERLLDCRPSDGLALLTRRPGLPLQVARHLFET